MASDPINLRGVVLTSRDFKEKDKIISFLSSDSGVLDICVKGTSKTVSKLAAITIPFVVADIVVTKTGNFFYLKDYSLVESNSSIMGSLEAMTVATHFSSLLSSSYIDETNSKAFYELLVYSLFYLSKNVDKYDLVYSAFNWKFLDLLGFVVSYEECNNCHNLIQTTEYFLSIKSGEIYCKECFEHSNNNKNDFESINSAGILALNHFSKSEYKQLFAIKLDKATLNMLVSFTTRYLSHQLEGDYNSLVKLQTLLNLYKI